jgi:hypothetical protein
MSNTPDLDRLDYLTVRVEMLEEILNGVDADEAGLVSGLLREYSTILRMNDTLTVMLRNREADLNAARREICEGEAERSGGAYTPQVVADLRGWHCYPDEE